MSLIRLTINRISYSQTHNGAYALLLNEKMVKENCQLLLVVLKHSQLLLR